MKNKLNDAIKEKLEKDDHVLKIEAHDYGYCLYPLYLIVTYSVTFLLFITIILLLLGQLLKNQSCTIAGFFMVALAFFIITVSALITAYMFHVIKNEYLVLTEKGILFISLSSKKLYDFQTFIGYKFLESSVVTTTKLEQRYNKNIGNIEVKSKDTHDTLFSFNSLNNVESVNELILNHIHEAK